MSFRTVCGVSALSLVMLAGNAWAQADEAELVEKVAVRNRLFTVANRWELGGNVGFTLLPQLTDHYNFNVAGAYNLVEWLAIEARLGYAYSRQTALADQVKSAFLTQSSLTRINDFTNMWQMGPNGIVGIRFQPIYGKLNLLAELPVHFQLYLWAGGGAGFFERSSLLICTQRSGSTCNAYFTESKVSPLVSFALGFRFFIIGKHAIRLEARTWSYLDSYFEGVDRAQVSSANPTAGGKAAANAGITTLSQIDLGYSFIF
jgi:outer membrane beta-barrel protein